MQASSERLVFFLSSVHVNLNPKLLDVRHLLLAVVFQEQILSLFFYVLELNLFLFGSALFEITSLLLDLMQGAIFSFCRSQIEVLLRESDVLPQVTNSIQRGGLRVEDLPEPGASTSSLLDSTAPSSPGIEADNELPGETRLQLVVGTGGPAGLWHFVYRSSYLDQYVASEFSPPLHTRAAQKR
jgi:hypothetical protein